MTPPGNIPSEALSSTSASGRGEQRADHRDARDLFEAGTAVKAASGDVLGPHEQRDRACAGVAQPTGDRFEQAGAEPMLAPLGAHVELGEKRVGAGELEVESEGADRVPVEALSIAAVRDHDDAQAALP